MRRKDVSNRLGVCHMAGHCFVFVLFVFAFRGSGLLKFGYCSLFRKRSPSHFVYDYYYFVYFYLFKVRLHPR